MPNYRVVANPRWSHSVPDGWLVPWLAPWLDNVAARNVSQGIGDYGLARAAVPCVRQVVCAPVMEEHARQTLAQRGHQGGKWGSANYLSEKAPKLPCIGVLIVASSSLSTFPPTRRPKTRPYLYSYTRIRTSRVATPCTSGWWPLPASQGAIDRGVQTGRSTRSL